MNNAIMIMKNLPMLLNKRNVILMFSMAVFLALAAISLSYYLVDSHSQAMAVEKEIQDITAYMGNFRKKEGDLKKMPSRPVEVKEIDAVQTEILVLIQSCKVQIMDLKVVKDGGTRESQALVASTKETGNLEKGKDAGDAAKAAATPKKTEVSLHRAYDVKLRGTYENIMTLLRRFGAKEKLVTIRKFSLSPMDDGVYTADVRYKIYVK